MPDGLDFARVRVVVCEANDPLRRNILQLLRQLGFGDVVAKEKTAQCLPLIERGPVDLLICDDQGGEACFQTVHGLRHHAIDNNPFVVSIGMVGKGAAEQGKVARAVNSGSDALLLKPFTSAAFAERVLAVAARRKPFVATADYIGPTRRQRPRNEREARMEFRVPNPVEEIASGATRDETIRLIRKGTALLDERKLNVNVDEIAMRAGDVRNAVLKDIDSDAIRAALAKLRAATLDIQRRMAKNEVAHVSELCRWMLEVADRIDDKTSRHDSRNFAAMTRIVEGFKVALNGRGNGAGPRPAEGTRPEAWEAPRA